MQMVSQNVNDLFPNRQEEGRTWYVAAGATGSGTSVEDPMAFSEIRNKEYGAGDHILLHRGDVFYGTVSGTEPLTAHGTASAPIVLGAYGEGDRPIISHAKLLGQHWTWAEQGFYFYDLTALGTFEGCQDTASNVGFLEDKDGVKWGIRCEDQGKCLNPFDFFCADGGIYVKPDPFQPTKTPFELLGVLRAGNYDAWDSIIRATSYMEIRDLQIQDGGYGIVMDSQAVSHLYIHDCVIQNIGGTRLGDKYWIKAGNGIEMYAGAHHVLVENTIFRNTYDVGITCQGGFACEWEDITIRHNVFAYNTQAVEFWTDDPAEGKGLRGIRFEDNLCINQGEGWGTLARNDRVGTTGQVAMTDVLIYSLDAPHFDVTFSNNIFYNRNPLNRAYSINSQGGRFFEQAVVNENVIIRPENSFVCSTDYSAHGVGRRFYGMADWQAQGFDKDSRFLPYAVYGNVTLEEAAKTSTSVEELFALAGQMIKEQ